MTPFLRTTTNSYGLLLLTYYPLSNTATTTSLSVSVIARKSSLKKRAIHWWPWVFVCEELTIASVLCALISPYDVIQPYLPRSASFRRLQLAISNTVFRTKVQAPRFTGSGLGSTQFFFACLLV